MLAAASSLLPKSKTCVLTSVFVPFNASSATKTQMAELRTNRYQ